MQDLLGETGDGFKDIGEGLKKVQAWQDVGVSATIGRIYTSFN